MLTKLEIRNFKRFGDVSIELGSPVVFIGPNNSGKTTALQALALWGMVHGIWAEFRSERGPAGSIVINRRDIVSSLVPDSDMLWRNRVTEPNFGITVEGISEAGPWRSAASFRYSNEESFACSLGLPPSGPRNLRVALLPAMSGLTDREFLKQPGEISFLIGGGRTAEVLRNLCLQVWQQSNGKWGHLSETMERLFGVRIGEPTLVTQRSEITMNYRDRSGVDLDLSCAGRGVHQTLLLLAYMAVNPGAVLLLDEPDAHLELLRQRQIYQVLCQAAAEQGSQIIAASHSEVILNEAADKDVVVAFLGKPHRIDDRGSQLLKSLKEIGFEHYYQAEDRGWVLYLEGSTDLAILQTFAATLKHPAEEVLARPFVHYVENHPPKARSHFRGLCAAKADLCGFLLCDQLGRQLQPTASLDERMWSRREIENYLCQPETLLAYAESLSEDKGPIFAASEGERLRLAMEESIQDLVPPIALRDRSDGYWTRVKASDDFLDPLFQKFFERLGTPDLMWKTNYHQLARFVALENIDPEVSRMLDAILAQSKKAKPAEPTS